MKRAVINRTPAKLKIVKIFLIDNLLVTFFKKMWFLLS